MTTPPIITAPPAKRWHVRKASGPLPEGPWPSLIGTLLANRGISLAPKPRTPSSMAPRDRARPHCPTYARRSNGWRMRVAAARPVAVFGDFDVDGVTSAVLLTENLSALGARPIPYLPHRVDEGYGLNKQAIDSLHTLGATLLITADCGTSSIDEIAHARNLGMDAMVLDHHTTPPLLPGALIVNPKRDPNLLDEPSAGGIAYYVLRALREELGRPGDDAQMLELVALSTVCDLAPLAGDNRRLVRDGLSRCARPSGPGCAR